MDFNNELHQPIFDAGVVYFASAKKQVAEGEADPELWERALDCFERLSRVELEPELRGWLSVYMARCHLGLALAEAISAANYFATEEARELVQSLTELLNPLGAQQ